MLRFDVDVAQSDKESRTITGVAVPFGKTAELNGTTYSFKKGSLSKGRALTPLLLDHDTAKPVGVMVDLSDGDDGSIATFRVDETLEGDTALATAASGSRGGLSVGVNVVDFDDVEGVSHVRAASLMEVSLVAIPAFADAEVTSVTASEDAPDDPIRGAESTATEEVESMEATEVATEEVVVASLPKPKVTLSLGEYVSTSIQAMRGDGRAAEVLAALDQDLTTDVPGLIPEVFENTILDQTSNPRTLHAALGKRSLPGDGKTIIAPREDRIDGYDGWRAWDSPAASQKMTVGTKTTQVAPWSYALAIHQDVQERSVIDFISYAYGRMVDQYYGQVEVQIADAVKAGAAHTSTSFSDAVNDVWVAGRDYGFAPNLILATPAYWAYLVDAEGEMRYSGGSASASPYQGNIAGLNIVVSPLLDTNYVVHSGAVTYAESEGFRMSAANPSALELEIALTKYTAMWLNWNTGDAATGYDDAKSLGIASFPTPTP